MSVEINQSQQLQADFDPMGDLLEGVGEQDLSVEDERVSQKAQDLISGLDAKAKPAKKRAYYWLKADANDQVFCSKDAKRDRKHNLDILRRNGYEVIEFASNREFFDHIKKDRSPIDFLMIGGHGLPTRLEDLRVIEGEIVSVDQTLTDEERATGFRDLRDVLGDKSIVLLDACLTGNKTVEQNLAKLASQTFPKSSVYASQYATSYDPWIKWEEGEDGPRVKDIEYGVYESDEGSPVELKNPVIYRQGVEATDQEIVPMPKLQRSQRPWLGITAKKVAIACTLAVGLGAMAWARYTSRI